MFRLDIDAIRRLQSYGLRAIFSNSHINNATLLVVSVENRTEREKILQEYAWQFIMIEFVPDDVIYFDEYTVLFY